jgi:xylulokinase
MEGAAMLETFSLGLDLGTSALKAVLLDARGVVVGQAESSVPISRPQPDWSEQDPQQWWAAAGRAMDDLRAQCPQVWPHVVCIGLAGQMHGAVTLDRHDRPIRPAILHNDGRAASESRLIAAAVPTVAQITGSRPMAGFTAPKLLWMSRHEAANFEAVDCVLSPKDYLGLRLTGLRVTDVSDAAGTLWFDVNRRRWSERMAAASGLSLTQLPPVLESGQAAGTVMPEVASRFGLRPGVVVAAGAGDTPASGIGIGAIEPGSAFVNLSTSASVVVVVNRPVLDAEASIHALCHALPGRYYQMGAMLSGASCLRWITRTTRVQSESTMLRMVDERMARQADGLRHAQQAPIFLPYLSGERTPHNNVDASGVFFGLSHETDTVQMGYAAIEGVCFGLRDAMEAVVSTGTQIGALAVVGGGARSTYWTQLVASALRRPVHLVEGSDLSAAIGAARLGWLATGRAVDEVCAPLNMVSRYQPDEAMAEVLDQRYRQFRVLYQVLSPLFSVRARGLQTFSNRGQT